MRRFTEFKEKGGFTLVEIAVVIALIAIIAGAVVLSINPGRQFSQARNNQRTADVNTLINAVVQNIVDNEGTWACAIGALPTSTKNMASSTNMGSSINNYNIANCLVPTYLPALPFDPGTTTAYFNSANDYNTLYSILRDATTSRITVNASSAELGATIKVTR